MHSEKVLACKGMDSRIVTDFLEEMHLDKDIGLDVPVSP